MSRLRSALAASLLVVGAACATAAPDGSPHAAATVMPGRSMPRFTPVDEPVPVLLFHAVCPDVCAPGNTYGVTRADLGRMLAMIHARGYTTITSEGYVRRLAGEADGIRRPIFVTFDDGRRDAYVEATPVLAAAGMQATMFVITDRAETRDAAFMSWDEVRAAQASGTWDIQLHADRGHVKARFDATPAAGAAYANRRLVDDTSDTAGKLEERGAWRARIAGDLDRGVALLAANVPGFVARTMAVPFGNYGQNQSNDPSLAAEASAMLDARFDAWFTQETPSPTGVTSPRERLRYTIVRTTTPEMIESWLDEHERAHGVSPEGTP